MSLMVEFIIGFVIDIVLWILDPSVKFGRNKEKRVG